MIFSSREAHRAWLAGQAALPAGFRVGTARLSFVPVEAPKPARMNLALIALDRPTADFAGVFTRNAMPGAPVIIGRQRLDQPTLGAVIINNKVANDCAPGGVAAAEQVAAATAAALHLQPTQVLPSSTGVIGWRLPAEAMMTALPEAVTSLSSRSVLAAAEAIMTTDLYPKVRTTNVGTGGGRIVGIAKGAGMVEPNMATMLAFLLTDLAVPRAALRRALSTAVDGSFNAISIDSDTSTSDSVVALSSGAVPCPDMGAFEAALQQLCRDLAGDVVRNGEGVHHVIRVSVATAPNAQLARGLGKAIVNSPLFKCAVCGNDPNVGRLVAAIGKYIGIHHPTVDLGRLHLTMGGQEIFRDGAFRLGPSVEAALIDHLKGAELYASVPAVDGVFRPPVDYPPHGRCVEIEVRLGMGEASAVVLGGDLTHEYISENADYRS